MNTPLVAAETHLSLVRPLGHDAYSAELEAKVEELQSTVTSLQEDLDRYQKLGTIARNCHHCGPGILKLGLDIGSTLVPSNDDTDPLSRISSAKSLGRGIVPFRSSNADSNDHERQPVNSNKATMAKSSELDVGRLHTNQSAIDEIIVGNTALNSGI